MLMLEPRFEDTGSPKLTFGPTWAAPSPGWEWGGEKRERKVELPPVHEPLFQAVLLVVSAPPWWQQAWSWPGALSLHHPSLHLEMHFKDFQVCTPLPLGSPLPGIESERRIRDAHDCIVCL